MPNQYWPLINPFEQSPTDVPLLREAFADWKIGSGIFDQLETLGTMPWAGYAESETLDIEYFGNRSGGKFSAPVVMNLLGQSTELLDADRLLLAQIIWTKFREPWKHLWDTNDIAYNPIHNYNMSDTRELVRGESEAKATYGNSVDTTQHGRTNDSSDYVYGLNNVDSRGKRSDRTTQQEGGSTVDSEEMSKHEDTARAGNETETTTRSGNIGVTTTQVMLESERKVWMWNFFDVVHKDIDSVLALPFYDPCRV